jgi:hypothetical protein
MKKQINFLVFIAVAALLFSCNKTGEKASPHTGITEESNHVAVEQGMTKPGFALRINTGLYVIDGEDGGDEKTKTKWTASLSLGENVLTGKKRKMTFNNRVYDFIEVRRDTKSEGYCLDYQIAVGGRLAVVVDEKANLYTTPKIVDATNTIIPRKTVVVIYPETESGGFIEVQGIDGNYVIPDNRYMRSSTLSRYDPDIQVSILLQTALSMTNANQTVAREALLNSAVEVYPDSAFHMEVMDIMNPGVKNNINNNEEED